MLKSCSRCGKIHDFNKQCYVNRQVRGTSTADKFRKIYRWHQKSLDIRERDKNLCRACLSELSFSGSLFHSGLSAIRPLRLHAYGRIYGLL